jgi:hypothetical protein
VTDDKFFPLSQYSKIVLSGIIMEQEKLKREYGSRAHGKTRRNERKSMTKEVLIEYADMASQSIDSTSNHQ